MQIKVDPTRVEYEAENFAELMILRGILSRLEQPVDVIFGGGYEIVDSDLPELVPVLLDLFKCHVGGSILFSASYICEGCYTIPADLRISIKDFEYGHRIATGGLESKEFPVEQFKRRWSSDRSED